MNKYVKEMVSDFTKLKKIKKCATPDGLNLFVESEYSKILEENKRKEFHNLVARALYLCKRSRTDISTSVAYLCTRVESPNKNDWIKLCLHRLFFS